MKPSILLVDDDKGIQFGFGKYLGKKGYTLTAVSSLAEARTCLSETRFDAVLLDLNLPDGNGIRWIAALRAECPGVAIVVITGGGDVPSAVEAMRQGADNFLIKPVDMSELDVFLQKSLELESLRRRQIAAERLRDRSAPFFGKSPAAVETRQLAEVAAANQAPVLLVGETGTGKGVLAEWIHRLGPRKSAAFVDINCSALGGDLLSSELFGHAKGAFTSAVQDREGLVEVAHGGTLFLDEVGDMDLGVQSRLLKTIEEKRFRRVGDTAVRTSDFRLICATNRDLEAECGAGRFRRDLFYRISVFPITLPPLRECSMDLAELAAHLLAELGRPDVVLSEVVLALFRGYPWPGNVRELRNALERALLLAGPLPLAPVHFAALQVSTEAPPATVPGPENWDAEQAEMLHLRSALERFGGDMTKAARALGISRSTLYRKLKRRLDS